jgi:hypothetical protein
VATASLRARAVVVALVVALPAAAAADVGVVVITGPTAAAGERAVSDAVSAAIDAGGQRARPAPVADARAALRAGAVPATDLAGFARVRRLVDDGWRAYLEARIEVALARLGDARRHAESLLPLDGGLDAYADAALRLGAALESDGRTGEADDALRLAAALDPGRAVTVQEFSPDVVAAHRRALGHDRARRRIRIEAPPGATVEVDGHRAGVAPVEVDVELGHHVVVARGDGLVPRGQAVVVTADGDAVVAVWPDRDERAAALATGPAAGQSARDAAAWIAATLVYAELDAVVLAASVWRGGRPALLVQWCDGEAPACTAIVEIGHDDGDVAAAARAAVAALAGLRGAARGEPTLPADRRLIAGGPRPAGDRCRWCRPALWAGAGLAVIAIAAAVTLLATGDDGGTVVVIDPDDF